MRFYAAFGVANGDDPDKNEFVLVPVCYSRYLPNINGVWSLSPFIISLTSH